MNLFKKLTDHLKAIRISFEESNNYFCHKFNPNVSLDEKFSIKNSFVKSYINEMNLKTNDNACYKQLLFIKLKNYFQLMTLVIPLFMFLFCTYLHLSERDYQYQYILRLKLGDFSLLFGGIQQYLLFSGILYMILTIINYHLFYFNISPSNFIWINLLRVLNGELPPKVILFRSSSDGILLAQLIFRSKVVFTAIQIMFYTSMIMTASNYVFIFFKSIFFSYNSNVWIPFIFFSCFYFVTFWISNRLFLFWLCYFYIICYYFHLKCTKLSEKINLINENIIKYNKNFKIRIVVIKRMITYHNTVCQQFHDYNSFWKKSYANTLFFMVFLNLIMFYQLFEGTNLFVRINFLIGVSTSWSLIFIMNYWAASLSKQMDKLSNQLSLIQWSVKRSMIKLKFNLLITFERTFGQSIGLQISGFGMMTFQLLSKVRKFQQIINHQFINCLLDYYLVFSLSNFGI